MKWKKKKLDSYFAILLAIVAGLVGFWFIYENLMIDQISNTLNWSAGIQKTKTKITYPVNYRNNNTGINR